ncbi:MAG TPA: hypothetical protein VFI06_07195 [Chitinophagaceae bacterium]|nr:hypothetical protein [Chitinophagaceae bacterium]
MKKRYLVLVLISSLVLMNACQREHSLENGMGPSQGTLQDDGTGDCFPKTVSGAYVVGTALVATSNYIDVTVDVTQAGNYTIYTDTVNGIHFRASGVFTTTGLNTVRLKGVGTPAAVGISNFVVNYGISNCTVSVTVVGALAVFTLDGSPNNCTTPNIAGTYTAGVDLNSSNTVTLHVTVTVAGAYTIFTTQSNNMVFSGSGVLAVGAQTIVLTGTGKPTTAGPTNIPVSVGSSNCGFTINVAPAGGTATYTFNCTSPAVNGTYTQNTALTTTNTIVIAVDVVSAGTYSISGTINGMTFSSAAGASFAAAGAGQPVTLTGTGTPTTPGANVVPITGGTASCNVTVPVNPAGGGAGVFTVNCATPATIAGTYTQGVALTAANTVTISVNVTTAGTYSMTTTAVNGMTFSSAVGASFAGTGNQTIVLTGTGTPTAQGAFNIAIPTAACNFTINVNPAGGGPAVFTIDCSSAQINGTYTQNTALTGTNTIALSVNVTTAGTYPAITTTATNGMTFSSAAGTWAAGTQTLTLTGTGTPNASGTIYIAINAGATPCSFVVRVGAPASFSDYFPRTTNSNWSYEFDDDPTDSVIIKVIASMHTALGNQYNIFMANSGTGFDTSGYWRKAGNDYYHYVNLETYLGVDNTQRVEFIFLKDNVATGGTWTSATFTNAVQGTPLPIRIKFILTNANANVAITSSTGTLNFPNTIIVEEHYEADLGAGFQSLDDIIGFYRDYFSKNVGLIKEEYIDDTGALGGSMEVRRYVVY